MANKVNISHVAQAAGVSRSTVSYVLSNKRSISPEVRDRVMKAIDSLGYKPSAVARNLAFKKTHTIGFYCSSDASKNDLFFLKLLNGAMDVLKESGFKVLLINEIEETKDYKISVDRTFPIDGAIITNARNSEMFLAELQKENLPFVLVGKPPAGMQVFHVDNDNIQASYMATAEFIKRGRSRVALIVGPSEEATVYKDYITGYMKAFDDYKVPFKEKQIIRLSHNREDAVEKALHKLETLDIDAVLVNAPTSMSAILVNRMLMSDLQMEKFEVTAFGLDLFHGLIDLSHPKLHVICSNAHVLGAKAGEMVLELIQGVNGNSSQIISLGTI